ncbi:MAG: DUF1489 domain-containing protein [Kordiimonadaceae bacterium]|jgi:hypothetical protein|nr:DUF1489 domain-containing protein [Kordiimonadaceae bacterium]MBT6035306.1 DUF1489 domain-containing protein [Kordiimonadaceae bacterium]MBT6329238.1 DUF1489 domain-containing protein [Kordiimonadaceae bacterium]MBT7581434.1 DUF1489 domain-containing protein [Kordiimonadaceae bacterium]
MTVHLIKLCVGIESVEHLINARSNDPRNKGLDYNFHITRFKPRRASEVIDGGSLYWVIKGFVLVRQRIIGLEDIKTEQGTKCMIKMDKKIHLTESQPRRAFQGWRYFEQSSIPNDLPDNSALKDIPVELRNELTELGLI